MGEGLRGCGCEYGYDAKGRFEDVEVEKVSNETCDEWCQISRWSRLILTVEG